jgi:glycosyltransferase involved in cell wall biosynthesis
MTPADPAKEKPPILGLSVNRWHAGWSSRQRIMRGLADRDWPTLYSSGAETVWEIGRPAWHAQPWLPTIGRDGKLQVDCPGRLLLRWPSRRRVDTAAVAMHAHLMRRALRRGRPSLTVLIFDALLWPYVRRLDPGTVIYYSYDAHHLSPGWTNDLARQEAELVDRADLIVGYTAGMLECLPGDGAQRGRVLPPGVDIGPFCDAANARCPVDLARIPHPRIGYVGRVNQKLDYELVYQIARARPDWHWVFCGSVGAGADGRFAADRAAEARWLQCRDLPNVHALGPVPNADVPRYLVHMDVNVMCYRTDAGGWWTEIFPLKSLEYLAAGKPIVSARVRSILGYASDIAFASTPDDWIDAIEQAIASGGVGTTASRHATARENTWDQRIDCLQTWIDELVRLPQ